MELFLAALPLGLAAGGAIALGIYALFLRPKIDAAGRSLSEAEMSAERATLAARSEALRLREEAEAELLSKRSDLARREDRLSGQEEQLAAREEQLDLRERLLSEGEAELAAKSGLLEENLLHAAAMTREEARASLRRDVEEEMRDAAGALARRIVSEAAADAERRARETVLATIERSAVDYVTQASIEVVELPSEDMKGRIIGRDGRNIRAFEQVAGVDLIVDDTPEAVVISCFDPVRRETARLALMGLMKDGRIHPARIEEQHGLAEREVARMIVEAGKDAAVRAGVKDLAPSVIEAMGGLRFRTSHAQNVLDHSVESAFLAANLASELGFDTELARRAAFLHDIGKALGPEWSGPHALAGMKFLREHGEKEAVAHAVGAHHYEIAPETSEAQIVIVADAISASRPGARRESLDKYVKRLASLERLAESMPGVDRAYAAQAGREVRLIVRPDEIDDLAAARLAAEVARRIESELEYPGQITVTVIREVRAQDVAK